jgi:hypothetical protein
MNTTKKAAILYKTDDHIDCDRTNIREQIEDILDDPNNLEFKEYSDNDSLLNIIREALGKPNVGVTACNIWDNKNTLYYGYFIDIAETLDYASLKNDNEEKMGENIRKAHENIKLNKFASQLSSQHVTGNFVIVKTKLSYTTIDNNVKTDPVHDTLDQNELVDIIESIFVKTGVIIKPDESMSTYKYIMNPLEHMILTDSDYAKHYVYHEYEIYTHVMIIIADTREINGTLNKIGTLLAGKPVNGIVFVALYKKPDYDENPPYASLSIDRLKEILGIRQRSPSFTTGMTRSEKEYVNFEKILELENTKYKDKPIIQLEKITGKLLNHSNY